MEVFGRELLIAAKTAYNNVFTPAYEDMDGRPWLLGYLAKTYCGNIIALTKAQWKAVVKDTSETLQVKQGGMSRRKLAVGSLVQAPTFRITSHNWINMHMIGMHQRKKIRDCALIPKKYERLRFYTYSMKQKTIHRFLSKLVCACKGEELPIMYYGTDDDDNNNVMCRHWSWLSKSMSTSSSLKNTELDDTNNDDKNNVMCHHRSWLSKSTLPSLSLKTTGLIQTYIHVIHSKPSIMELNQFPSP
jgi:hypothetical protein